MIPSVYQFIKKVLVILMLTGIFEDYLTNLKASDNSFQSDGDNIAHSSQKCFVANIDVHM